MKLIIKNLGPIQNNKQAIDLTKRFYVFVGKNNSGKTYVSQLLWTIFNQETIHKFANQIDIQLNFEENKIEISKEIIDEILDKFAIFLKKEIANVYKLNNSKYEKTVLDNFSLSFRYDLGKFKAEKKSLFNNRRPFYTIAKPCGGL